MAKANSIPLTVEILRAAFDYDPDTGIFTRTQCADASHVGDVPSSLDMWGYIKFRACGKKYAAHRLAWFYVFGEWPREQIDHKNRSKTDNWIGNLRDVPQSWNQQNRTLARKDNKLGILGVHFAKQCGKYHAQIGTAAGKHNLGFFDNVEEAQSAREAARLALHEGFIHQSG